MIEILEQTEFDKKNNHNIINIKHNGMTTTIGIWENDENIQINIIRPKEEKVVLNNRVC